MLGKRQKKNKELPEFAVDLLIVVGSTILIFFSNVGLPLALLFFALVIYWYFVKSETDDGVDT